MGGLGVYKAVNLLDGFKDFADLRFVNLALLLPVDNAFLVLAPFGVVPSDFLLEALNV